MAGTNQFLPFATGAGANVLSPTTYAAMGALSGGFTAGVANSQQMNTVWRQSSFIASGVAQLVANVTNVNINDDGNLTSFVTNLQNAISAISLATSGTGSVTTASIVSANGFAGSVANPTTTPAFTLTTTASGVLKGNAGALEAAAAGTDYAAPGTATNFTAKQTFAGTSSTVAAVLTNAAETVNVVASAPSATQNFYMASGAVQYFTGNASANFTVNFAHSSGTTLNGAMAIGESMTCSMIITNGATPYYANAFKIDGTTVTPKWQGGVAPSAGNASSLDAYTFTIIKTAANTFTVLAAQSKFA